MMMHARRTSRAFTLVEMMVVIAVILVLAALTLSVTVTLTRGSETRETQNLMTQLEGIVNEWQTASGRTVRYGVNNEPCNAGEVYELNAALPTMATAQLTTDELFRLFTRTTESKEMIARINPTFVEQVEAEQGRPPTYRIFDAWGTQIIAILPGRSHNPACGDNNADRDRDGTIRTDFERRYGIAHNRTILFVSAGPDGEFGDLEAADGSQQREFAKDNLYSYPPEAP